MESLASPPELLMATMLAGIAFVLLLGALLARLAGRLRQPAVIGEIVAGILLGPSVLGHLPGNLPDRLFPADVRPLLSAVAQVGLVLFMFLIGWEFEKRLLRPNKRVAVSVAVCSVGLAFSLGVALGAVLHARHDEVAGQQVPFAAFVMFMGAAMSVTAFPVLARILSDNRLTHTRVGALALACAAVDDLLAWCLLAYVSALVTARGAEDLARIAVLSAGYIAVLVVLVRPLLAALVTRWAHAGQWNRLLVVLCAGAFLSAYATTWIGIHAVFGAFLFGFIMPSEPALSLAQHVHRPLEHISVVLLPVFFIVTGLNVDIGGLRPPQMLELTAIIAVAVTGKLVGTILPTRLLGLPWRESLALGLLMNTRGLTELIILNVAVTLGVLDQQMFTMMVIMALVTTTLAGPLLPRRDALAGDAPAALPLPPPIVAQRAAS